MKIGNEAILPEVAKKIQNYLKLEKNLQKKKRKNCKTTEY